ncbi:MAG: hypothetical protein EXS08_12815 [Planctomycetes bacterium]|nr:hypothetical protein [Planctomycetota bacterium]
MIRCRVARGYVEAAQERALALEERWQLDEHVGACARCAALERRARALQELLEGPGDPRPNAPDVEAASRAVFAALERGAVEPWRPQRSRRVLLGALGVCALVAGVAALLLLRTERGGHAPVEVAPPAEVADGVERSWSATGVEAVVRAALLASFSAPADLAAARARFGADTREVARAGWPVRRFVEGLLDGEGAAAPAAARCLGALGDANSAPALERALAKPALVGEVLSALGALGEPSLGALERALARPALALGALRELCRVGGPRAALVLERAARLARADAVPSRASLLDALTTTGPASVASLLRLAGERLDERDECGAILARLPLVAGAGPELARALERERPPGDLAYRALLLLRPDEALPWLEERCASHRERALALETLASYAGAAVLASALNLAEGGRVARAEVVSLLTDLLERDAQRGEDFSRRVVARADGPAAHAWLALLIESAHPGAARALVPLVFCAALADDDRQWAALAVGELGTADDAELLARELAASRAALDERRTAACLLSIHARLGSAGVERALAPCSPNNVRRVLAAFEGQGEAVRLHRVARALDGVLSELAGTVVAQKEIL